MDIKTLADIDVNKINLNNEQKKTFFKSIKHKEDNQPFEISDTKMAEQLIILNVIKRDTIRIKSTDPEECYSSYQEPTGKYLITPEGILYRDKISNEKKSRFWTEFRAWVTLIIAISGLVLSIVSLIVNTVPS